MNLLGGIEQAIVREVIGIEQLQPQALAYDTTNFYTHIAAPTRGRSCRSAGTTNKGGTIFGSWAGAGGGPEHAVTADACAVRRNAF